MSPEPLDRIQIYTCYQSPTILEHFSGDSRRELEFLASNAAAKLHFSLSPLISLSGTITASKHPDAIYISIAEQQKGLDVAAIVRLARRALSLMFIRAATIDRACAVTDPQADFACPITLCVMRDPVVAADGRAYERSAIVEGLAPSRHFRSPCTNLPMASAWVAAHDRLCRQIGAWAEDALRSADAAAAAPRTPAAAGLEAPAAEHGAVAARDSYCVM